MNSNYTLKDLAVLVVLFVLAVWLTSCDKREDEYNDMMSTATVAVMEDNSYTSFVTYSCDDTVNTYIVEDVQFGVAYVVNLARIPFINDINDEFEFYAMKDGIKYTGDDVLQRLVPPPGLSIINVLVDAEIPYNKKISVYVLKEHIHNYEYFIQKGSNVVQLQIDWIY
tara:strand:- start:938 stop:1441 length:504 start_codon:yes stop_codon:yes gene_type:complete